PTDEPWAWGPVTAHQWRMSGDISDDWGTMIGIFDHNFAHAAATAPGTYNDPDMLEVGNGGMTDAEYRTHFGLWALMSAPLIAGNDVRSMSDATRTILTNHEVIAVDQDPLGFQATLDVHGERTRARRTKCKQRREWNGRWWPAQAERFSVRDRIRCLRPVRPRVPPERNVPDVHRRCRGRRRSRPPRERPLPGVGRRAETL